MIRDLFSSLNDWLKEVGDDERLRRTIIIFRTAKEELGRVGEGRALAFEDSAGQATDFKPPSNQPLGTPFCLVPSSGYEPDEVCLLGAPTQGQGHGAKSRREAGNRGRKMPQGLLLS